jgi:hypothetical protein
MRNAEGVTWPPPQRARQIGQRAAARVDIEHEIAARQQFAFDVIGDLRRRSAGRVAGKAAVQIAGVKRRGAGAGHRGREVRRRQDDDMTADFGRIESADQPAESDLAFVLVAVIAGHQQDARAFAIAAGVAYLGDRDRHPAVRGAVNRIWQAEKAGLLAIAIEIDLGGKAAPHGWHRRLLSGGNSGIRPVARPYKRQPRNSTASVDRPARGHYRPSNSARRPTLPLGCSEPSLPEASAQGRID